MKNDIKILSNAASHWLDSSVGIAEFLGVYNGQR
jgi:uncharacterized membrane protein YhiD involved in acid resistance